MQLETGDEERLFALGGVPCDSPQPTLQFAAPGTESSNRFRRPVAAPQLPAHTRSKTATMNHLKPRLSVGERVFACLYQDTTWKRFPTWTFGTIIHGLYCNKHAWVLFSVWGILYPLIIFFLIKLIIVLASSAPPIRNNHCYNGTCCWPVYV